jgi:hypothetical protein
MINEQQWKLEHSKKREPLSFFAISGLSVTVLIVCMLLCLCCKRFKCWSYFRDWFGKKGSCHTILFKPKIIKRIQNSNDLPMPSSHATLSQVSGTADETELVTLVFPSTSKFRKVPNKVLAMERR